MITNCVKKPPVNHHYVPQSYLRYFSNKHKKEWQIIVADKTKEDAFITNIENVASERNFNKVERRSDPYYWESYYATEVDDLIKPTFDTIIAI
jgi:hypothetical protein